MTYSGKQFESDFYDGFVSEHNDYLLIRLHDQTTGFRGSTNPCDFLTMGSPIGDVMLELKVVSEGARFPFSRLTYTQYHGMLESAAKPRISAGVLVYFAGLDRLCFIDINDVHKQKLSGKKSVHVDDNCLKEFRSNKKRTRLAPDTDEILDDIMRWK